MNLAHHLHRPVEPTPAQADALVAASRLRGAVFRYEQAIHLQDERAQIAALADADAAFERLKALRGRS